MLKILPINIKNMNKYLSLAFIAGLFFVQANAQHRDRGNGWGQQRGNSQNSNRERQRRFDPQRQQAPVASNHSNRNWSNNEGNRQDRRFQPRDVQRQPRSYGNHQAPQRWNNHDNNRYGNNRYGHGGGYPRSNSFDHYRRGNDFHRPIYSSRNPGWRYSYLPRRHSIISSFLFPFQTISWGGYNYRYCDGVYYRPYNNVFQVVAPPIGIYINVLPYGYRRIVVNDYPYYYYNGTYYDEYNESYRVVAPPVGAVVESIPEGYETITIDGETYYKVDDVQYKPIVQDNGEIWYEVIKVG